MKEKRLSGLGREVVKPFAGFAITSPVSLIIGHVLNIFKYFPYGSAPFSRELFNITQDVIYAPAKNGVGISFMYAHLAGRGCP